MNKQPGGNGCLQAITCWPFTKAGGRGQDTKKSPSTTPTTTSLKHLASPAARGAGLALVLSAASSKGTGKGQLSMKGREP